MLDKYCRGCHNERLKVGGLALDTVNPSNIAQSAEIWGKVARKLRLRDMPPAGRPRPDEATYDSFATSIESALDAKALAHPNPGRPALHRLNRTEYAYAIRDLLALDIDVSELLPPDDSTYGFDNISDVLGVSPLLLESYMNAARKISRVALGNPEVDPIKVVHRAAFDETQDYHLDGLPLGTRGGQLVRHEFPVNGNYEIRIALQRSNLGQVRGLDEPHDIELALDGVKVQLFHVDGGPKMYAAAYYDANTPSQTADEGLHITIPVTAGPHDITATFPAKTFAVLEDGTRPALRSYITGNSVKGVPHVASITVSGPFSPSRPTQTPSRDRILTCRQAANTEDTACAKQIISSLARSAYRRTPSSEDVATLLEFYQEGSKTGGFEAGIEMALWRILSSPQFVFRYEFNPSGVRAGTVYRLSDSELASRLSFFLWSSIPDDELLKVAARGDLKKQVVLERQVRRMLADPRSRGFVENFAGQWLFLRNLRTVFPNATTFRDFDDNLRQAFLQETEHLFDSILRENRSVLDFLNADYTFVNERLARHYGIPNVAGSQFRRVPVADENRRGLLGHGSILTVTSYANRTSPVLRGKWVLENILGLPPPPPPPDVPELAENGTNGKVLAMRERMAQHRTNAVCASCHTKMDPIGLSLENFDAIGGWRVIDDGETSIDAKGQLPDGTPYEGPAGLRKALMRHPDAFAHVLTEKLLTYAVGRGLEVYDAPAIRSIMRDASRNNYTLPSLIMGVIKSAPFQMRRTADPQPPLTTGTNSARR